MRTALIPFDVALVDQGRGRARLTIARVEPGPLFVACDMMVDAAGALRLAEPLVEFLARCGVLPQGSTVRSHKTPELRSAARRRLR